MNELKKKIKESLGRTTNVLDDIERAKKVLKLHKKSLDLLKAANAKIAKQNEVTADELCHLFRDALETRVVIPRGARAPNGMGTPRRYYRESCANPGSTALKRLRCQKLCCRSYSQHIVPSGTRPGDRDHCEGIECNVKRRPRGTKGQTLLNKGSVFSGPPAASSPSSSGARPASGSEAPARRRKTSAPKTKPATSKKRARSAG